MSASSEAASLELLNPEGGGAHTARATPNLNPQLQQSIDRFQEGLSATLRHISRFDRAMIVLAVGLATCAEVGVTTAVNVVLPDMQGNVGASPDQISWVITVYSAAFLCALPLNTAFARFLGHRNHLLLALLLYSLGCVGCFASRDLPSLLTARVVMGIGGGSFLVRSQATIYRLYQGKERGKFLGAWGLILCLSKAGMPLAFGEIAEHAIWNDAFLLAIPIALISAMLLFLFVPKRLELVQDLAKPDLLSIVFLIPGLTAFQVFISRGEQDGWLDSPRLEWAAAIALFSLAGFVIRDMQRSNANPLLNLRVLFSERELAAGLGIAFFLGVILGSGLYILPQYLRTIQDFSAGQTGEFFLIDGFATLVGVVLTGKLLPLLGIRPTILLGLALFLIGNSWTVVILTTSTPSWIIGALLLFHGASVGMLLVTVGSLVLSKIDLRLISFGASIYLFFRQLGTTLGVTATVVLIDVRESLHSARLLSVANSFSPAQRAFSSSVASRFAHLGLGMPTKAADQTFANLVSIQARLLSYIDIFWVLQFVAIVAACMLLPGRRLASENHAQRVAAEGLSP